MRHSVVLLVSADAERRAQWSRIVQQARHWPLAAATLDQAVRYLHKVRPNLVLIEAQVGADRGLWLLDELRAIAPLQRVPVVVVGPLTPAEAQGSDPAVYVWVDLHDATLHHVLEHLPGPRRRR